MYSIYQIYQSEKLVYSLYHTMNNQYSDKTKLDIILTAPTTPLTLCTGYYLEPNLYSIKLYQDGIDNALKANEILSTIQDKAVEEVEAKPKAKKPRTKKALQSKTEG